MEEHEHVRDTTHPLKHYGCIYVTRSLYEVTFPMSYRNVGSSCPHYRERRRSPHRTDSGALYAVGGGSTGPASSVTTNFTPYYLDNKYRREDTPVLVANPKKTTLNGGQSRSWSAEQGKENKRKSLAAYPHPHPHPSTLLVRRKINKITRRIYRRYAGLGRSRVRTRIPSARRQGQWVWLRKILHSRLR